MTLPWSSSVFQCTIPCYSRSKVVGTRHHPDTVMYKVHTDTNHLVIRTLIVERQEDLSLRIRCPSVKREVGGLYTHVRLDVEGSLPPGKGNEFHNG